jgi:hypothetical protein
MSINPQSVFCRQDACGTCRRHFGGLVKFQILSIVCLIFCAMSLRASAEMRVWHDKSGNEYAGEYERTAFGKFFFRGPDKNVFSVVMTNLVDSDLAYVNTQVLPEIKIQFRKRKQEKEKSEYSWGGYNEVEVKAAVTVRKLSKMPYSGTLLGEVYLIAQEVATDDYRLFAKKKFQVVFPDEKDSHCEVQLNAIVANYIEINHQMRGAFYKGYVVIVSDPDGNLVELKTTLWWITEEKLDAFRRLPVPGFFNQECRKKPVPRMDDWEGHDLRGFR